ncbi:hypothetical protein EON82_15645 [bacterium]|nr:MAG: hypothetical protein EON82_15645 [bacterium]
MLPKWAGGLLLLSCFLAGCKFGTFPDPNDPRTAGDLQPEVLRRQVKGASDALYARVLSREITEAQYRDLLAKYSDDLLKSTNIEAVDPAKAWEYGEVFRTARQWKAAEAVYRIAVEAAKDDDRRVNDTLKLAEAMAHLGKISEAIEEARKSFTAAPQFKAPILYGVLYEIAPAAQGKGKDALLARLLEDAVRQSDLTEVDPASEAGQAFAVALPHHQRNARELAATLYLKAGKANDAERVLGGKLPTMRI